MLCDMCGSESDLFKTKIEGTEMNVCKSCARFGEIISPVRQEPLEKKKEPVEGIQPAAEKIEMVVPDFAEKIRKKREQLNLDQEKFADLINQKRSLIHKMENSGFTPSIPLAKTLEKRLDLKLIERYAEQDKQVKAEKGQPITIGDLIKIRKRR